MARPPAPRPPAITPFGAPGRDRPLRVRAEDHEDLTVIAAYLQDAVVPVSEMSFEAEDHRFVMSPGGSAGRSRPTASRGRDRIRRSSGSIPVSASKA